MTSPLSPEAVAQMVADREAGTPGPWSLFDHAKGKIMAVCIGAKANGSRPCIIDSGGFDSTDLPTKQNRANASRSARLPDLEAAYLTLAAENATLRAERDAWTKIDVARDVDFATLRASEAAALERITELEAATQLALDTADMSNNTRAALLGALNSGVGLTPTADKEPTT